MFLYLFAYCAGSIFILVIIIALAIAEGSVENSIRRELRKYGYQLVSVKTTKRRSPIRESPMSFWEKHVIIGYGPARYPVSYKGVTFKNDENEIFQNIAAIERSRFFSTKVHFEVGLEQMREGNK
jgi:hypothetical protein